LILTPFASSKTALGIGEWGVTVLSYGCAALVWWAAWLRVRNHWPRQSDRAA
jgi:hypothetical protein